MLMVFKILSSSKNSGRGKKQVKLRRPFFLDLEQMHGLLASSESDTKLKITDISIKAMIPGASLLSIIAAANAKLDNWTQSMSFHYYIFFYK